MGGVIVHVRRRLAALRAVLNREVLARTPFIIPRALPVRRADWSIGVLTGDDPFGLVPHPRAPNPRVTGQDVGGWRTRFVADPFLVVEDGRYHAFFEAIGHAGPGSIAHASSVDGSTWSVTGTVLREPFHLSYPNVVRDGGRWWMLPETVDTGCVRLYACDRFPDRWSHAADLFEATVNDPTLFHHGGRWWIYATDRQGDVQRLRLFGAPELRGPWREHPRSPMVEDDRTWSRCGGAPFVSEGTLYRVAQDGHRRYGERLLLARVTRLDPDDYAEEPAGELLGPGPAPWWRWGVHHLSAVRRPEGGVLALVDGLGPAPWRRAVPRRDHDGA